MDKQRISQGTKELAKAWVMFRLTTVQYLLLSFFMSLTIQKERNDLW